MQNSQLGCACIGSKCYPENCDHVYLFENDFENAMDIQGEPMHGRFPYDEKGRIILEVKFSILFFVIFFKIVGPLVHRHTCSEDVELATF